MRSFIEVSVIRLFIIKYPFFVSNPAKTKLNFLVCPSCKDVGSAGAGCSVCSGREVVLPLQDKILYWGLLFSPESLLYEKITRKVRMIINVALGVIGLSGIALMAYLGYLDNFQSFFSIKYWLAPGPEKFYFWLTLLLDLYLYYRLEQETSKKANVVAKQFGNSSLSAPALISWRDVESRSGQLIDVSRAFAEETFRAVQAAWELARHFESHEVLPMHLLGVLFHFDKSAIILARLGINFELFKQKISRHLHERTIGRGGNPVFTSAFTQLLLLAYTEAHEAGKKNVELDDLILAFASPEKMAMAEDDTIKDILTDFDVNFQKLKNVVAWIRIQESLRQRLGRFRARARYKPKRGIDRAMTAVATPYLDQFSEDLTLAAKYGRFFPCLGREKEFEKIFRIFEASRQGALLVGPVGVGKSAIIQGLAEKMVAEDVPEILRDKRLVSLNVSALVAGVGPSGAEERLINAVNEIVEAGNIVLVIENAHLLYGIGVGAESSLDMAEVFAEFMAKGLFYCLATTTNEGFASAIENKSLAAAFQPVKIEELELNDAICVLEAKSGPIEYQNKVYFSYGAIEQAAVLSAKYIHERYLPQKAIGILEQAGIKVKQERGENKIVLAEDVAEIISGMTKIPLTAITEKETEKLLNLEEKIQERIIEQDEAVKIVAASLRRARLSLREGKRPIAGLLFLGPTGVGKTELAKTVASVYFGDEKNMVRFDMSEYQTSGSVNRLIGHGSNPGLLTEAIRKKPFCLILFDEVEKAHPDILNLFLQVLDDGRLTDAAGRTIDFTNTIIIMTTNAGAQFIQDEIKRGAPAEEIRKNLLEEKLRDYFQPEFLNRFDGVVVFKPLSMVAVIRIAHLLLNQVIKQLADKGIEFQTEDEAVAELAELGFDPKFGARPLRRVIQEHVDDALANYLLRGEIKRRDKVILEVGGRLRIEKAEEI